MFGGVALIEFAFLVCLLCSVSCWLCSSCVQLSILIACCLSSVIACVGMVNWIFPAL